MIHFVADLKRPASMGEALRQLYAAEPVNPKPDISTSDSALPCRQDCAGASA